MARKKIDFLVEYSEGFCYTRKEMKGYSIFELLEYLRRTIPQYAPFSITEIKK